MAALDYLFEGSPPQAVTTAAAASNGLPEWYAQYLQGIAGKATETAGRNNPVPQMSIAGFTPDELKAQQMVRDSAGTWQPGMAAAHQTASGALPAVTRAAGAANDAVAGPAATWTSNFSQYMSPFTDQVVSNIARLGTRNFEENIMPGINASMIGTGNFGSTRNAEVLGNAGRDVQADISGQQSQAMQQGYGMAADIFGQDAARQQQQSQMQAGTWLAGGNAQADTALRSSAQQGALSQAWANMGLGDAQALEAVGAGQRQQTQLGYDTAFANQTAVNDAPWQDLNRLNSTVRGMQLPENKTMVSNGPAQTYRPGALQQIGAAYGMMRS